MVKMNEKIIYSENFKGYQLEVLKAEDIDDMQLEKLLGLFSKVYGEKASYNAFVRNLVRGDKATWRWKYQDPRIPSCILALAFFNDELVAHTALQPKHTKVGENTFVASQATDSMVKEEHRRKHLFTQMSKTLYELVGEFIPLIYAYPNQNNYYPRIKLGFIPVSRVPLLEKTNLEGKERSEVVPLETLVGADALWDVAQTQFDIGIVRNSSYFSWRYLENPYATYRILGCKDGDRLTGIAVTKEFYDKGHIIDILAIDEEAAQKLIQHTEFEFSKKNKQSLSLFMLPGLFYRDSLLKIGFQPVEADTYFMIKSINEEAVPTSYLEEAQFFTTMGDNDVF